MAAAGIVRWWCTSAGGVWGSTIRIIKPNISAAELLSSVIMNNQGFHKYDHVAFKHSRARWEADLYWHVNVTLINEKRPTEYKINNDGVMKMRAGERQQFETFDVLDLEP